MAVIGGVYLWGGTRMEMILYDIRICINTLYRENGIILNIMYMCMLKYYNFEDLMILHV